MASGSHPTMCSLRGAKMIQPVTQGSYDGLCGLYCIINAIRLVMAPHRQLRHEEVRTLFTAGVRFLERRGSLSEAVHSCVGERDWPKLAKRIVATAESMAGREILLEQPAFSTDAPFPRTLGRIERMIVSGKAPCVFLRGRYRHYSVISGYTPLSLKLFDSIGHHWVWRRSCGTTATPMSLHRFHVQTLVPRLPRIKRTPPAVVKEVDAVIVVQLGLEAA